MLTFLNDLDIHLFLFINGNHNSLLDWIMWTASDRFIWIPLYIWFLWLLFREYKRHFWLLLAAVFIMILASDQLGNIFKYGVMRIRPSNDPAFRQLVHIVKGYTGASYSFYSAHASNSVALAVFMILMIKRSKKYIQPVVIIFALLVSYSRIYLGVHYPLDVMAGAAFGAMIAIVIYKLYGWALSKLSVNSIRIS
jgi:undecaprenyl-diphosphatase